MTADAGDASACRTYPSPPVVLPVRDSREAQPVRGCETCGRLDQERRDARNRGDHSAATDCSVLIRRHPDH
ncbi:hypothetical protein O7599_29345 [Streptomyces sp. WMMC500]|uniref:hypothetical protein n=1 Tax=Streptomyces sp. WMMC500 TaxID=3015154 RepID=UPI00248B26C8|nr:hypothetical protein [Streptomyces sp. WMMC500]WBB59628.1 hypothetical protein O7599_29345 [Streptomyces sp. WMMC500]